MSIASEKMVVRASAVATDWRPLVVRLSLCMLSFFLALGAANHQATFIAEHPITLPIANNMYPPTSKRAQKNFLCLKDTYELLNLDLGSVLVHQLE
jgi:hypothetical protein